MIGVPLEPPPAAVQVDADSLYRSAVSDRRAGRAAEAAAKLEQVLLARPEDVDARLNLGLALLTLGRLDEAHAELQRVTDRAPGYADAWIGLARIAQRRGDLAAARDYLERAEAAGPDSLEVEGLRRSLRPEATWRMEVTAARSRLSGGLPDWSEARVATSRRLGDLWAVGLAVESTERFDDRDVHIEARVDRRFARGAAYVAVGGAPDPDYRPELAVAAGGQARLAGSLAATFDASLARYPTGTVTGLHPGLAVDLAGGRYQLSGRWINVWDERGDYRSGYAASARWQATERLALRLGYADAPESSDGSTTEVAAWSAGAEFGLTDRLLLRTGYVSEDREAYDRRELSLGLGLRF